MSEALQAQNYIAYIDLVTHLKNLSILSFDSSTVDLIEKVEDTSALFCSHIDNEINAKLKTSEVYAVEEVSEMRTLSSDLKLSCEYRFSGVIERICIASLRKTVFRDLIPEAQGITIFYDSLRDFNHTVKNFNRFLISLKISPCEV